MELLLILGAWCAISFALAPTVGRMIAGQGRDPVEGKAIGKGVRDGGLTEAMAPPTRRGLHR